MTCRGALTFRLPLAALAAIALLIAGAPDAQASSGVHTSATEHRKAERLKTVPIGRSAWQQARSVVSLGPDQVGALAAGDRIEGAGEVEISVCLKPNPRHPGSGHPCIGEMYGFNPTIKARIVLAPNAGAADAARTLTISRTVSFTCSQKQPARNHHCVAQVPWGGVDVGDVAKLPCAPAACHMNLLVSAHHPDARDGHRVVVGANDDRGRIHQGKAKLSSARFVGGKPKPAARWSTRKPARGKLPVVANGRSPDKRVVYSLKLGKLKQGDQLIVDARPLIRIGHLPYNVFQRTEVILTNRRGSTKQKGKIAESTARISASNGFNCTLGKSGHRDPCTARKTGFVSIGKRAGKGDWYVNVVVGHMAIGTRTAYSRWRPSHSSKVRRGGYVKVEKYSGSSACASCSTGGWKRFSASERPSDAKPRALIEELARFGITEGTYQCRNRKDPPQFLCGWRAEGRFGSSPRYECESKAWWDPKRGRWDINVCKDALGAQLWHRLTVVNLVQPTFAGVCKEQSGGTEYRCKWYAEGVWPGGIKYWCKGFAVYSLKTHTWRLDPCDNQRA